MITVVSGLPRSGTSLVMQMLAAGGQAILSDHQREADVDNPRGYLEDARVRSLEHDVSWLGQAEEKAVKVISFLLNRLPEEFQYRVLFLQRDLQEVLLSQAVMLQRLGQPAGPDHAIMTTHFQRHLKSIQHWLSQQPNFQVLNVSYQSLINNPGTLSQEIVDFLQRDLDVRLMSKAVDPALYRQRRTAGNH